MIKEYRRWDLNDIMKDTDLVYKQVNFYQSRKILESSVTQDPTLLESIFG